MTIDKKRTALLMMDLQTEIMTMFGDKAASLIERSAKLIEAARQADILVIYVVVAFRPGYPELSLRNPMFARVTQTGRYVLTTPGVDIVEAVRPREGDIIVVKHRVSAFAGTDLEMILRAKGIETLVLGGVATSGVVLSTVRHGADADYQVVVVQDCCVDGDDEVHRVLTEKVFPRQATVLNAGDVIGQLQSA